MKYKVTLSIGFANAKQEEVIDVCDQELSDCVNDTQRENLLQQHWDDWANNYIDGGIYPADEDD